MPVKPAPLLLLPGLMCDETIWAPQVESLADFSPMAVPGYPGARSLVAMAEQSLRLAPPRFSLAGHSMGGRVALEVVRLAPQRVERLALLDTGVHPPSDKEAAGRHALLATAREQGIEAMVDAWLPPMVHPGRRGDVSFMSGLRAMLAAGGAERYGDQVEAMLARPDPRPLLGSFDGPALVGVGRQDAWSTVEQNRAIAAAIPGAEFVIFEDCGHMAPVEAPEQVSEALRRWLLCQVGTRPRSP
ncbi:alpha/beta fold hydrolase [Sphingosinicella terrae]|uniref:alpha/beta fold hydrolase n=1 Tax=Sphingosinicella terrae TaxID=2172047 RepID=UPI0013B43CCA|nr:alpha/beta fold hydrolase [Sphingosinicella terrae]